MSLESQEARRDVAGWFWLWVSHVIAVKTLACVSVTQGLPGWENPSVQWFSHMVVGRRPQCLMRSWLEIPVPCTRASPLTFWIPHNVTAGFPQSEECERERQKTERENEVCILKRKSSQDPSLFDSQHRTGGDGENNLLRMSEGKNTPPRTQF